MSQILLRNYKAEAAAARRRIVKPGATAGTVVLATGPTDKCFAITDTAPEAGERVDCVELGHTEVEAGGAFAFGDPITSDGVGRAVLANPAAGVNNNIVGWARGVAVALGDHVLIQVNPGRIQGAA